MYSAMDIVSNIRADIYASRMLFFHCDVVNFENSYQLISKFCFATFEFSSTFIILNFEFVYSVWKYLLTYSFIKKSVITAYYIFFVVVHLSFTSVSKIILYIYI